MSTGLFDWIRAFRIQGPGAGCARRHWGVSILQPSQQTEPGNTRVNTHARTHTLMDLYVFLRPPHLYVD